MKSVTAINWNEIEDEKDLEVWTRLTNNFWLDTRIPLSNDIPSWGTLTEDEKLTTIRVFTGLTLLDTVQSDVGVFSLLEHCRTPHEREVYNNIMFMESVHAKSYSSIFSTLCTSEQITETFRWAKENPYLLNKRDLICEMYSDPDPMKRKIASVFLESFLFYSGFYLPFYWSSRSKLTNTADIIRLIVRDEAVHGYYIGYKFQLWYKELDQDKQDELKTFAYEFLYKLYENEVQYTRDQYDGIGWTEDVIVFLHYNANKALMNLGFEPLFPHDISQPNPSIMSSLSPGGEESHDFFSGAGSTYVLGKVETTQDDDWDLDI